MSEKTKKRLLLELDKDDVILKYYEEIKAISGLNSMSSVLRFCIMTTHKTEVIRRDKPND